MPISCFTSQIPITARAGLRLNPRARTQSSLPCEGQGPNHLNHHCYLQICMSRRLELNTTARIKTRHHDMGCVCLNHQAKCLVQIPTIHTVVLKKSFQQVNRVTYLKYGTLYHLDSYLSICFIFLVIWHMEWCFYTSCSKCNSLAKQKCYRCMLSGLTCNAQGC